MISIVIPAHNEANVIGRCLASLLDGAREGELDVVVVCNGCSDATADVARRAGPAVRVIETDVPSKSNALNLGDRAARSFPRFYVDADVVLPLASVREVARVLESGAAMAAAPRVEFDLAGRPWTVRAFYDVWGKLPYVREGMIGSGAYAVSEAGRGRFGEFPAITADDAFVRLKFRPHERMTVDSCAFTVTPPATLGGIIKIKTRSHFGNYELRNKDPRAFENEGGSHRSAMMRLALSSPVMWPKLSVYAFVKLVTRVRTIRQFYFGNHARWERDDTSRQLQPKSPA